ncbi:MAG: HD domain-containing protein [Clostridia bacterium]|nr:HD domain-containing protein [Clostridia bacterium]
MSQLNYESLSSELSERIKRESKDQSFASFAFDEGKVIRRKQVATDIPSVLRTPFIRDIDKIMHCPYYNRYTDKTQVFSFYKNDDITRRALHVQLVSRIARTLGKCLHLNLDLIEAIALGHDIGHTPFGHTGEKYLDELFFEHAGRHFSHNIHSVRVLDKIYPLNISLQTLSGIASHDGELELSEYRPRALDSFEEFDKQIEACYLDKSNVRRLVPSTLEGCVMRICDIIAYLGKDRQDAMRARDITSDAFSETAIGVENAEIINNLMVNIIENSYGKDYIMLDEKHFEGLKKAKSENYEIIYLRPENAQLMDSTIKPMMGQMYEKLLSDLKNNDTSSPIFAHHIDYVNQAHYKRSSPYECEEPNQIVVDYIASMTDDYFIDLYAHLFPKSGLTIKYKGYFE